MITSKDNTFVKELRRLKDAKARRETGCFIAEGPHLVRELVASEWQVRQLLVDGEVQSQEVKDLAADAQSRQIPIVELSSALLRSVCETETPQGIAAVAERRVLTDLNQIVVSALFQVLIIDRVQDPGNLGTLLRTAWGFAVDLCILTPGTADVTNGKTLRSSMGGAFHLPVIYEDPINVMAWARKNEIILFAGDAKAKTSIVEAEFPERIGLMVGNEGAGISEVWRENSLLNEISIPMPGGAESLNVAVAAAIMLYEANRSKCLEINDWL